MGFEPNYNNLIRGRHPWIANVRKVQANSIADIYDFFFLNPTYRTCYLEIMLPRELDASP